MKSILQVFSSNLAARILMACGLLLLVRYLPAAQWADYTFAFALVGIAAPMLTALFNMVFIVGDSDRTRHDATRFFSAQLWICLALLAASPLAYPWEGHLLMSAACLNLMQCLSEFAKTCYQQQQRFSRLSLIEFSRAALFVVGIGGLIAMRGESTTASDVLLVQAATMVPLVLPLMVSAIDWRGLLRFNEAFQLLGDLAARRFRHLTGYYILLTLLGQSTIMLLRGLGSELELATFGTAFRFYGLIMLALNAVLVVQLPAIKQAADPQSVRSILQQHRRLAPWFTLLIAAGAIASPWLIPLIDGGKYPAAPGLFQILSVSVAISFVLSPYSIVTMRAADYRFMFRVMLLTTPLSIAGCGLLFQVGGSYAIAWGFVATYLASNLAIYLRARRLLQDEESVANSSETLPMAA